MKSSQLISLLENLNNLEHVSLSDLDDLIQENPYCQNYRFLKVKKLQLLGVSDDVKEFQLLTNYMTNPPFLYDRLTNSECELNDVNDEIAVFDKKIERFLEGSFSSETHIVDEDEDEFDPKDKDVSDTILDESKIALETNVEMMKKEPEEEVNELTGMDPDPGGYGKNSIDDEDEDVKYISVKTKKKNKISKSKKKKEKRVKSKKTKKKLTRNTEEQNKPERNTKKVKKEGKTNNQKKSKKKRSKDRETTRLKIVEGQQKETEKVVVELHEELMKYKQKEKKEALKKSAEEVDCSPFSVWLRTLESIHHVENASDEDTLEEKDKRMEKTQKKEIKKSKTKKKKKGKKKKAEKDKKKTSKMQKKINSSLDRKPVIASQTLAEIMVKQGHIKQGIDIYNQLMLLYPEKSRYFAAQIKKLK